MGVKKGRDERGGALSLPLGETCVHAASGSRKTEEAIMITNVMKTTLHIGLGRPFQGSNAIIFLNYFISKSPRGDYPGSVMQAKKPRLRNSKSKATKLVSG